MNYLRSLDYHVDLDEFTDQTPIGRVKFANIIATSDTNSCKQLAIACHHDSKMMEGFLGAIDSAVPCSMMLELAKIFKGSFKNEHNSTGDHLALMFIFFDGEEAFHEWTATDSLYGSRHLAAKWEKQSAPAHCKGLINELKRLDLLMVLDLIGTSDTSFTMFSRTLKRHYMDLQRHEKDYLRSKFQLQETQARQASTFKSNYIPLEFMQDDHVPFYKRGVPVLSLLASPFPSVWHTIDDNYNAIDFPKTRQILHTIEKFVSNYNSTVVD